MNASIEIFKGGFVYGNSVIAAQLRERLNHRTNLHANIRWELARKGALTYRQLVAIFGGVAERRISSALCVMRSRGHLCRTGIPRNYLWMLKAI